MITIITGTPGAGKTLYAIEKLLLALVGTEIPVENDDGETVMHPRTIYTNINGLQIDHELVQADSELGLHNWHAWAKPGAVIVVDEFQKIWPPRPNGSKVPDDVQAFDTHRHMGVDFILITQNVMNCDRHLHGLCNRHLHVRRMANLRLAIVYEWDHCSRALMFSKALTKHPWRYNRKVFKLYKSAKVHTKQPRSLPGVVWFIAIAIIGLAVLGPTAKARLTERISGMVPGQETKKLATAAVKVPEAVPAAKPASEAATVASAPLAAASAPKETPMGCIAGKTRCDCFTAAGVRMQLELAACIDEAQHVHRVLVSYPVSSLPPVHASIAPAPDPKGGLYVVPYSGPILPAAPAQSVLGR